jgi:hypothetical protein
LGCAEAGSPFVVVGVGIGIGIGRDPERRTTSASRKRSRILSITSEFDDCVDPAAKKQRRQSSRAASALPELISDAYRRAAAPVRRKLLERLLRPVGSLALAAIASGAFSAFLLRRVTLDDVARITAEQFVELARFVDQVNPDVLQQILSMLA